MNALTVLQTSQVQIDNIEINYYYQNTGKPSVVLVHGLTDGGICWERVARSLIPKFDVYIPDLRGHGYSSQPISGYTYLDFYKDISKFIDKLALSDVTIVGHSIGADIAMLVAEENSKSIVGIVMEDPPWEEPFPSKDKKIQEAEELRQEILQFASWTITQLEDYYRSTNRNTDELDMSTWAHAQKLVNSSVTEWVISDPTDWRQSLSRIDQKALLLTADVDYGAYINPKTARDAVEIMRMGKQVHFEKTGHVIHREHFDLFMDTVLDFLNDVYSFQ